MKGGRGAWIKTAHNWVQLFAAFALFCVDAKNASGPCDANQ